MARINLMNFLIGKTIFTARNAKSTNYCFCKYWSNLFAHCHRGFYVSDENERTLQMWRRFAFDSENITNAPPKNLERFHEIVFVLGITAACGRISPWPHYDNTKKKSLCSSTNSRALICASVILPSSATRTVCTTYNIESLETFLS